MVHGEHVERHHLDEALRREGDRRDLEQGAQLLQHERGARQVRVHADVGDQFAVHMEVADHKALVELQEILLIQITIH